MEQKCIKAPVYINETVFSESAEIPVDIDFTLPDYCPDVMKILKCRAVSRISSKGLNGRSVTVDGSVTVTVLYCDSENKLYSYEYQYPFSKSFDVGQDIDTAVVFANSKCEYINCRAVTGRKIDIHGAAAVNVRLQKRKCTQVISDVDDSTVELKRGVAPATSPMGSAEKYVLIEEEIEIGQGQPPIRSLLRYDAYTTVKESKLIAGKSVVKGELILTLMYCSDEGNTQNVKTAIPYSQLLEIEGVNDGCECAVSAKLAYLELKPKTDSSGNAVCFQMSAKLHLFCECYCNNEVDIILDAYSRKYEAEIQKNDIAVHKVCKNIQESFNCKKNLEFSDGQLSSVADLWCDVSVGNVKIENGELCINGTVIASIIAIDCDERPEFYEKTVDFTYRYQLGENSSEMSCEPNISVTSANYTIIGSKDMELRIEMCINAAVCENKNISLITDVNIDRERPCQKSGSGALTVYFAVTGESVWDIARRYSAAVDEIMQINEIEEDLLQNDKMILVPLV